MPMPELKFNPNETNPKILEEYYASIPENMTKEQMLILLDSRGDTEAERTTEIHTAAQLFEKWMVHKGINLETDLNLMQKYIGKFDPTALTDTDLTELKGFHEAIKQGTSRLSPTSQARLAESLHQASLTRKRGPGNIANQAKHLIDLIAFNLANIAAQAIAKPGNQIARLMQRYPAATGYAACGLATGKWIIGQLLYGYFYGEVIPEMASYNLCGNYTNSTMGGGMKKYRKTNKRKHVFTMKRKSSKRKSSKRKSSKRKSSKRKSRKY